METEERRKLRIDTQPMIFKLWKLKISHNHPNRYSDGSNVINVYWSYHWLGAKVDRRINIYTGYRFLFWKLSIPFISIPPYHRG